MDHLHDTMIRRQVNKFLENLSEGTRSVMSHYFLTSNTSQLTVTNFERNSLRDFISVDD